MLMHVRAGITGVSAWGKSLMTHDASSFLQRKGPRRLIRRELLPLESPLGRRRQWCVAIVIAPRARSADVVNTVVHSASDSLGTAGQPWLELEQLLEVLHQMREVRSHHRTPEYYTFRPTYALLSELALTTNGIMTDSFLHQKKPLRLNV